MSSVSRALPQGGGRPVHGSKKHVDFHHDFSLIGQGHFRQRQFSLFSRNWALISENTAALVSLRRGLVYPDVVRSPLPPSPLPLCDRCSLFAMLETVCPARPGPHRITLPFRFHICDAAISTMKSLWPGRAWPILIFPGKRTSLLGSRARAARYLSNWLSTMLVQTSRG